MRQFPPDILDKYAGGDGVRTQECEMVEQQRLQALSCHLHCLTCPVMYDKADITVHPGHISPYLWQRKHRFSVVRRNRRHVRPLVLLSLPSDPFYHPLSFSFQPISSCIPPLQTDGFCHLNFFSVFHSGASRGARVHVRAYLHDQIQTAHYTGGTLKVNCWSCVAVFV